MEHKFCEEHTEVIKQLGGIAAMLKNGNETMSRLEGRIGNVWDEVIAHLKDSPTWHERIRALEKRAKEFDENRQKEIDRTIQKTATRVSAIMGTLSLIITILLAIFLRR